MRGGKSPKLAEKASKKALPGAGAGQTSRGNAGGSVKPTGGCNGGSNVTTGKKRKKKKDKQLPPTTSRANEGKGSNTTVKQPVKGSTTPKTTRAGSGKYCTNVNVGLQQLLLD